MHPNSQAFDRRIIELNHNAENYYEQILDSIEYCKDLKTRYEKDIEVRLYRQVVIWKMFITNHTLWLQHYRDGFHVDQMPMYCFEPVKEHRPSLYDGFKTVFEKRWRFDEPYEVSLKTWKRADYSSRDAWK